MSNKKIDINKKYNLRTLSMLEYNQLYDSTKSNDMELKIWMD